MHILMDSNRKSTTNFPSISTVKKRVNPIEKSLISIFYTRENLKRICYLQSAWTLSSKKANTDRKMKKRSHLPKSSKSLMGSTTRKRKKKTLITRKSKKRNP